MHLYALRNSMFPLLQMHLEGGGNWFWFWWTAWSNYLNALPTKVRPFNALQSFSSVLSKSRS